MHEVLWIVPRTLVFLLLLLIIGSLTVTAQTGQAQLDQLIEKLKAEPKDIALRDQVIKLASESNPVPAISESARRAFVQGNTFAKEAKNVEGQKLAIQSFQDALKLAPWWGDAYYNLAIAQELAGALADSRASLGWYIKTKPGEKEERAAQDRIYGIEAKEKLAQTNAANEAARAAQKSAADEQIKRDEEAAFWRGRGTSTTRIVGIRMR